MCEKNASIFAEFDQVHTQFAHQSSPTAATKFHSLGRDVRDIIYSWERRLCAGMERGVNGQYSRGVSQKFWDLVKKRWPLIDQVGLKISQV